MWDKITNSLSIFPSLPSTALTHTWSPSHWLRHMLHHLPGGTKGKKNFSKTLQHFSADYWRKRAIYFCVLTAFSCPAFLSVKQKTYTSPNLDLMLNVHYFRWRQENIGNVLYVINCSSYIWKRLHVNGFNRCVKVYVELLNVKCLHLKFKQLLLPHDG